jgi:hypothetical protein
MLRRLAALATCVVFLGAVPTGSLYVTTLPTGSDIWVDGTYIGRSPVFADALAAGRHTVGLAHAGWTAQQIDVTVIAAQTTLSALRLEPAKTGTPLADGTIAIHGVAVKTAYVDGLQPKREKDGALIAAAGSHELTLMTAQGKLTRTITVWPQARTDVVLQPDTTPTRPVVVAPADDYLPADAIIIDGDKVVIRAPGHEVIARIGSTSYRVDGKTLDYASAPTLIGKRLYLPLDLLAALAGSR